MIQNNNNTALERTLTVKINGFDYVIYVSPNTIKCFCCRKMWHLVGMCLQSAAGESSESSVSARGKDELEQTDQADRVVRVDSSASDGVGTVKVVSVKAIKENPAVQELRSATC